MIISNKFRQNAGLILLLSFIFCNKAFAATPIAAIPISTCAELQAISNNLAGDYALINPINCSGFTFKPIGTTSAPFKGRLDGAGLKISNLLIPETNSDGFEGLFGVTSGATILNLILDHVEVDSNYGPSGAGALIGNAIATNVTNVSVTSGMIKNNSSNGMHTGGLVGMLTNKSALNLSSSSIDVTSFAKNGVVGGLVGYVNDASITKSYATGSVSGHMLIGGLVGTLPTGSITQSYATGNVTLSIYDGSSLQLGGLIGSIGASPYSSSYSVSITDCYATGNVNTYGGAGAYIGGLIGYIYNMNHPKVSNSFATGNVAGASYVGGLIGYSDAPMFEIDNSYSAGKVTANAPNVTGGLIARDYSNGKYVYNSYWDIQTSGQTVSSGGIGKTTAEMYQQKTYVNWDFNYTWKINEGTSYPWLAIIKSNVIQIKNCTDLQNINKKLDASYELVSDIDCNGVNFIPIGTSSTFFTGGFNGNGYTLSNLTINQPSQINIGLFGYTQGAHIINVILKNVYVAGKNYVGTLIGYANSTEISGVSSDGQILTSSSSSVGAIGGLVGELYYSSIIGDSMAAVTVNAKSAGDIGGLVGYSYDHSQIINSYAIGNVLGGCVVGGLVGCSSSETNITNSYSTGSVTAMGTQACPSGQAGGLVASQSSTATIVNSYYDIETSGQTHSTGGIGKTTAEMFQKNTYVGWNFDNIWDIEDGKSYPWLKKQIELKKLRT